MRLSNVSWIKTQDFSQAITLLFKAYGDVQSAISQCIPSFTGNTAPKKNRENCVMCAWIYNINLSLLELEIEGFTKEKVDEDYEDCKELYECD